MLLHEHKIWHSSSSSNVDPKKQHRYVCVTMCALIILHAHLLYSGTCL